MAESSRLRWQCRRGMRELDELLVRYLEHRYETADAAEKAAFRQVLELPDPELNSYLLQQQVATSGPIANIVSRILELPQT